MISFISAIFDLLISFVGSDGFINSIFIIPFVFIPIMAVFRLLRHLMRAF